VSVGQVTSENPNATLAAGSTSVGVAVIYGLGLAGINPTPEAAAALSGIATSVLLFIGHSGVKGFFVMLWRGRTATKEDR
jgi:hypothetical protein